jgi:hypothetical protein
VTAFGGTQVATAVIGYQPADTGADDLSVDVDCANRTAGRAAQEGTSVEPRAERMNNRDMPPEVQAVEDAARQKAQARMRSEGPALEGIRPRYSDLAEGATTTFYIATTGSTITARKMHANAETTSAIVFAEVVSGNPVINKATALSVDQVFGTANSFDPAGLGIGPRVRGAFGSEWSTGGGRDGESKVIFVLLSSNGIGGAGLYGFFRPNDAFPKTQIANSNEGEILYMNANYFTGDMFDGLATVAHEFQHMCNFNQKYIREGAFPGNSEEDTINEGQSVLAEEKTGFGASATGGGNSFLFACARAYLQAPHNYAFFTFDNNNGDYGKGYLLMKYINDRFGTGTITSIATSGNVGMSNIATYTGMAFGTLFQDWALTNMLDPVAGAPAKYTYTGLNLDATYNIRDMGNVTLPSATPARTFNPPTGSATVTLKAWSNSYTRFSGGDGSDLDVTLDTPASAATNLVVESPAKGTFSAIK